jgi:hypothetical protein
MGFWYFTFDLWIIKFPILRMALMGPKGPRKGTLRNGHVLYLGPKHEPAHEILIQGPTEYLKLLYSQLKEECQTHLPSLILPQPINYPTSHFYIYGQIKTMPPARSIKKSSTHRQMQAELKKKLESVQQMEENEEKRQLVKRLNDAIALPEEQLHNLSTEKLNAMQFEWESPENIDSQPDGDASTSKPSPGNSSSDKPSLDSPTDKPSSRNSSTETLSPNSSTTDFPSPDSSTIAIPSAERHSSGGAPDDQSIVYDKVHGNEDGNQARKKVEFKMEDEGGMFVDDINDLNDLDYNTFYEPQDVEPTFSFPGVEPADDGATVGYAFSDRFCKYINRYGKRSVARYRLEKHA